MEHWVIVDKSGAEAIGVYTSQEGAEIAARERNKLDLTAGYSVRYKAPDPETPTVHIQMAHGAEPPGADLINAVGELALAAVKTQAVFPPIPVYVSGPGNCGLHDDQEVIEGTEIDVPRTDLQIAQVRDGEGPPLWWLLGACGEELIWILDADVALGLITALQTWLDKTRPIPRSKGN